MKASKEEAPLATLIKDIVEILAIEPEKVIESLCLAGCCINPRGRFIYKADDDYFCVIKVENGFIIYNALIDSPLNSFKFVHEIDDVFKAANNIGIYDKETFDITFCYLMKIDDVICIKHEGAHSKWTLPDMSRYNICLANEKLSRDLTFIRFLREGHGSDFGDDKFNSFIEDLSDWYEVFGSGREYKIKEFLSGYNKCGNEQLTDLFSGRTQSARAWAEQQIKASAISGDIELTWAHKDFDRLVTHQAHTDGLIGKQPGSII